MCAACLVSVAARPERLSVSGATRDSGHHSRFVPFALLLAAAARGIGVDGAVLLEVGPSSEPLTQGSEGAFSARHCTEPAGSGHEDGPRCAVHDEDGSGSPSRGVVTCASHRKPLLAGASCASSLPARAEVVTTRLAQTNSRQFGAGAKTANAAAIYLRRPATGLRVRKTGAAFDGLKRPARCPGRSAQAEVQPYEYHQPCGHRISGDLSGFGALASKGRCMTDINRADSASEKFRPTICAGATSICGDRSCACMTGLNHQRPSTPTVDGVIVMPSPEFPPSCQRFRADVFAQQTVDAIDGRVHQEFQRRRYALFFSTRFLPRVRPFTRRDPTQPMSIRILSSMKR